MSQDFDAKGTSLHVASIEISNANRIDEDTQARRMSTQSTTYHCTGIIEYILEDFSFARCIASISAESTLVAIALDWGAAT